MSVSPDFKTNQGPCPCGCELYGTYRRKVWKDGTRHVSRCQCRRCTGGRVKGQARLREHTVARAVGGTRTYGSGAAGGNDVQGGICSAEETANQSVTRGIRRWWESKTVQAKVASLYSDNIKPRAVVLSWENKPQLVVQTFEDFEWLCQLKGTQ